VTTQKPGFVYVHVLDWPDEALAIPKIPAIRSAKLLASEAPVRITEVPGGMVLHLPVDGRDPADTVVVLEVAR
jgi:hypothetical protein